MNDYLFLREDQLREMGFDPRGRGYVDAIRKSPWRGKINFDLIVPFLFVGSVPVFDHDVRLMADAGVKGVVDLCRDNEHEDALLAEFNIAHYPEFVPDTKAPSQDQLDRLTSWIDSYVQDGKKVYIHCHAGRGRAPTVACAYLITKGYSLMDAFDHVYKHRVSESIQVSRVQHEALAKFHARRK